MQTKTLNTIQTVSTIARILSTIFYVFSLIGAIFCAAGILSLRFLPEGIKIGGTTIRGLIEQSETLTTQELYVTLFTFLVVLVGNVVLGRIAMRYFKNELKAGTPFTFSGAKELMCLGICLMVIPVAAVIVARIVCGILFPGTADVLDGEFSVPSSVLGGALLLAMSLLCRHGAELTEQTGAPAVPQTQDDAGDDSDAG